MARFIRWLLRQPLYPPPPPGTAQAIQAREQQVARQRILDQARVLNAAGYRYPGVR